MCKHWDLSLCPFIHLIYCRLLCYSAWQILSFCTSHCGGYILVEHCPQSQDLLAVRTHLVFLSSSGLFPIQVTVLLFLLIKTSIWRGKCLSACVISGTWLSNNLLPQQRATPSSFTTMYISQCEVCLLLILMFYISLYMQVSVQAR